MAVQKKLTPDDAKQLSGLATELEALQAQYGQHAISFEELKLQKEAEARNLREQVNKKAQEIQALGQVLVQKYQIPTDSGPWTLNTTEGVFIGPQASPAKPGKSTKRR